MVTLVSALARLTVKADVVILDISATAEVLLSLIVPDATLFPYLPLEFVDFGLLLLNSANKDCG